MPYVLKLADHGVQRALGADPGFLEGLNVAAGQVTYAPVAEDQGLEYTAAGGGAGPRSRARGPLSRASQRADRPPTAATLPDRMPTTSQLIRKGRTPKPRSSPRPV